MILLKKQWLLLVFGIHSGVLAMDPTASETERKIYAKLAALQLDNTQNAPSNNKNNALKKYISPFTIHATAGCDLQGSARYSALPQQKGFCGKGCDTQAKL